MTTPAPIYAEDCTTCEGTGILTMESYSDHPYGDGFARESHIDEIECYDCRGEGYVKAVKNLCAVCATSISPAEGEVLFLNKFFVHADECATPDDSYDLPEWPIIAEYLETLAKELS